MKLKTFAIALCAICTSLAEAHPGEYPSFALNKAGSIASQHITARRERSWTVDVGFVYPKGALRTDPRVLRLDAVIDEISGGAAYPRKPIGEFGCGCGCSAEIRSLQKSWWLMSPCTVVAMALCGYASPHFGCLAVNMTSA